MKKLVAILLVLMLGLSAVGSLAESEKTNVVLW